MITSRGVGLVFAAVLIFVLAGVTRVGWLLLFDAVLWGTIVVSAVMPWLASGKLQVRRRTVGWDGKDGDPGPMEGSTVEFEIAIRNIGWLPAIFVTVDYNCEGQPIDPDKELLFIAWLGRRRSISATARVSYERRGRYRLPPPKTWTTVPFSLFRRSRCLGEQTELIVLPTLFPLERLNAFGYTDGAAHRPLAARSGGQTTGSRTYFPGDALRHVHWRNTARMAQLQVKEYEKEPESSLAIVLSAKRAIRPYDESLEHAIKIAAMVGDFVCRNGGAVRLLTGEASDVTSDRYALLKELALLSAGDGAALADALQHCPPSSDVLALVDGSDAEGVEALARHALGQQSVTAVVLRGFEGDEADRNVTEELRRSGIGVVECRRGDLLRALASLEGTSGQPDQSGSATASDARRWDAAVPR